MATIEEVTNVIDGNTFETDRRTNVVRLSGVDAPGKDQKGYAEARNALQALIGGKRGNDRNGGDRSVWALDCECEASRNFGK